MLVIQSYRRLPHLRRRRIEARILTYETRLQMAELAGNKLERFSRRNNFRLSEYLITPMRMLWMSQKDCLKRYFGTENPQIERAHRDGPQMKYLPRHLLGKNAVFSRQ